MLKIRELVSVCYSLGREIESWGILKQVDYSFYSDLTYHSHMYEELFRGGNVITSISFIIILH